RVGGYRRNRSNAFRLTVPQFADRTLESDRAKGSPVGLQSPVREDSTVLSVTPHCRTLESDSNSEDEQRIRNGVKSLAPSGASESGAQNDSGAEGVAGKTRQQGIESNAPESNSGRDPSFAPPRGGAPAADGFDAVYAQYPEKVEKRAAQAAYVKAIKRGVDPAIILRGAMRYAAERAGQDPKYTKHPATWLNKGCWDDEASPRSGPQNRNAGRDGARGFLAEIARGGSHE